MNSAIKKALKSFAVLLAVSAVVAWFAKKAGTLSAVSTVQQEAISQHAPTGFFDVQWLASRDEVKKLRPKAAADTAETMSEQEVFYGRRVKVTYYFQGDVVLMFIITFLEPASSESFAATRMALIKEYGPQSSVLASTDDYGSKDCSVTNSGRFSIDHCLRNLGTMRQEQIIFARGKG